MHRCLGPLSCSVALSVAAMVAPAVSSAEVMGAPTVVTGAASSQGQTSATLNATVNPAGSPLDACEFEYGTTLAYGDIVPCSTLPASGSSPVSVSALVTGLRTNTTYHFRISATSLGGTSEGSDETFRTLAACAGATTTTTSSSATTTATISSGSPPPAGGSCWEEIKPYPFGSLGSPVELSSNPSCIGQRNLGEACYLTVTSMAFNAWNRGLADTAEVGGHCNQPCGVWLFDGSEWYPDPKFPGSKTCKGDTVVWAGNLDYWLIGPGEDNWPSLCRFNGHLDEWGSLEIPQATKEHVAEAIEEVNGKPVVTKKKPGGITSASCFAWNDCWFFGTYGAVVHWNGTKLIDASPESSQTLLQGEYTAAAGRDGPAGEPIAGLAVSATSERWVLGPLSTVEGSPPTQLYGSAGEAFSPLSFAPLTKSQPGDPFRTDLVAVDLDRAGQGWAAGNPAGLRLAEREGKEPPQQDPSPLARPFSSEEPQPSPLEPVSTAGTAPGCTGPPPTSFTYTPYTKATAPSGSFLWSSISVVPTTGEALAGGHMRRATAGSGPNEDAAVGEPVIVQAACGGTTTATRFRIQDPTAPGSEAPADRTGGVTAVAANAANDAWAATSRGTLTSEVAEPPRLYRLTNGQAPEAPEGTTSQLPYEEGREATVETPTRYVFEAPKPEPALEFPAVAEVAPFVYKPRPATYAVKAKVATTKHDGHVYYYLHLTFRLRRPVTIGAQALLRGHVVSEARPKHFKGRTGLLILRLERSHWPTKIRFIA